MEVCAPRRQLQPRPAQSGDVHNDWELLTIEDVVVQVELPQGAKQTKTSWNTPCKRRNIFDVDVRDGSMNSYFTLVGPVKPDTLVPGRVHTVRFLCALRSKQPIKPKSCRQ